MLIVTKHPENWQGLDPHKHVVMGHVVKFTSAERVALEAGETSFRDTYGTKSGPCVILGMGESRHKADGREFRYPVFAINRAITEFPKADYWCVQDYEALKQYGERAGKVSNATLVTYSAHFHKPEWSCVNSFKKIIVEIFPDPRRHKRRPLFWNESTVGWAVDLAIRMGYGPIYFLGIDRSVGAYTNPDWSHEELVIQHTYLQERMLSMFNSFWYPAWNPDGVEVVDVSENTYIPIKSESVENILCPKT